MGDRDGNKIQAARSFASDARGMSGAIIGVLFATVVVISAISVGIATPSSASEASASQEHVDAVSGGVQQSLADINEDSTSRATGAAGKSLVLTSAWERIPAAVRPRLKEQLGAYVAQMEAQGRESGHVTRIEPAGRGVRMGLFLHQKSTGSKMVRKNVTETYTETVTRTETRQVGTKTKTKRKIVGYRTRTVNRTVIDHYERVWTGEYNITEYSYWEPYKAPVYRTETRTIRKRVRTTREVPIYETYTETYIGEPCPYVDRGTASWDGEPTTTCPVVTETKRRIAGYAMVTDYEWVTMTEEYKVIDHYVTRYRKVHVRKEEPIYEKKPVYTTVTDTVEIPIYENVTTTEPIYDEVNVTETVTKTRNVTKNVSVSGTPFTHQGKRDWTLATDVTDARRATMTVKRGSLATSKDEAMTFQAVDASGDTWTLTVWRDGQTVIVETSAGVHHEVDAANVTIDLLAGTVGGDQTALTLANGLDEVYALQFRNGDEAKGTYEFVVDGTSAVSSAGGLQVKGDIIYEAVFDVTYSTQDTTYTDRITITPAVDGSS